MAQNDTGGWDDINAEDVASYIRDVSEQLANMARLMGLAEVAEPLEQAHRAASARLRPMAAPEDVA